MCIAYLAINPQPDWSLFIAANRDEFHGRPTLPAAPWENNPDIIAGIDCEAGGTWLGISKQGRFGLITNFRDPASLMNGAPSRGKLVSDFLFSGCTALDYSESILASAAQYNGFNLICGDGRDIYYIGNRNPQQQPRKLGNGSHVLSNHFLDTPWPKAERLRTALNAFDIQALPEAEALEQVFSILKDNNRAPDADLPQTGLSLERERLLSSPFIISPDYGTRCSTVIAIHKNGQALFSERTYNTKGEAVKQVKFEFLIEG